MPRPTLAILLALTLLGAPACTDPVDHLARAQAIERELLRAEPEAGYDHHRYVLVLRELNEVPIRSARRTDADAMARTIMDGRRVALARTMPQAAHLPRRLQGVEAPRPTAPRVATPRPATPPTAGLQLSEADKSKLDVTLYSTTWCGYCRRARAWMTANGVPFVEKDIEADPAAHAEYTRISNGYTGVPLIAVNGTTVRGFDQGRIQALIAEAVKGG